MDDEWIVGFLGPGYVHGGGGMFFLYNVKAMLNISRAIRSCHSDSDSQIPVKGNSNIQCLRLRLVHGDVSPGSGVEVNAVLCATQRATRIHYHHDAER